MPYGYVVDQITVTDPDIYPTDVAQGQKDTAQHCGDVLVRGGQHGSSEDILPGDRTVVTRFPFYEKMHDWCHSNAYAGAKAMRMAASTNVQTIVEGV